MTIVQQNWFLPHEAATYCRVSARTLRRWRKDGRVRSYSGRYQRADLDRAVMNLFVRVGGRSIERIVVDELPAREVTREASALTQRIPGETIIPASTVRGLSSAETGQLVRDAQAVAASHGVSLEYRRNPVLEPDTSVSSPEHEGDYLVKQAERAPGKVVDQCPTCDATSKVRRKVQKGVLMTGIGCTDDWHPV